MKRFGVKRATLNFTGAGHGRNAADGVRGNVKNMYNQAVAMDRDVTKAKDIADLYSQW